MVKIAIVVYSTYGHVLTLGKNVLKGVQEAGGEADLFQVPETLPKETLALIGAPGQDTSEIPLATPEILAQYDAFLFGIPTRFGTVSSQWAAFWDQTGAQWSTGAFAGKPCGLFVSTGSPGGGQESTIKNSLSYLVHHGMIYVPLGYANVFGELSNTEELHGGSSWGAGTLAGADGSRQPTALELKVAITQGKTFYQIASKLFSNAKIDKTQLSSKEEGSTEKTVPATLTKPSTEQKVIPKKSATTKSKKESKDNKCCVIM
ncbi:flavodoxin-like fold protein [Hanseniaspora vineae]